MFEFCIFCSEICRAVQGGDVGGEVPAAGGQVGAGLPGEGVQTVTLRLLVHLSYRAMEFSQFD